MFGENVRRLREARGWSLEQFSEKCGVSFSMIAQVERGLRAPSLSLAAMIADVLGVTLDYLLKHRAA